MERVIFHIDMNNFFASVECMLNPSIANKAVVVCGDPNLRHGIVLAKNMLAKSAGIKTGEPLWQAHQKCANLVCVVANHANYVKYSKIAREIYKRYSAKIEPFGLDEVWMDVSAINFSISDGKNLADEIREVIKEEMGITASVGVSFNKIFAKLGSDYKKPDATTVISKENFKDIVWKLPANDLFFCGRATTKKLNMRNIFTIGDIACANPEHLRDYLGKNGVTLWNYANGYDTSPVADIHNNREVKSIGNSTTTYRDLITFEDIKCVLYMLGDSVASKLRRKKLMCKCIKLSVKYGDLSVFEQQVTLSHPTNISEVICKTALDIFIKENCLKAPVRSLGIRLQSLVSENEVQTDMFFDKKAYFLENAIDKIRNMYGEKAPVRGINLYDMKLCNIDADRRKVFYAAERL